MCDGVVISENIWRLGDRISSGVRGSFGVTSSDGMKESSSVSPKTASNSVKNIEKTGAGMLSVGEKTMPTLRILILLTSELSMIVMRNADRARRSVKLGFGSLCMRAL